MEEYKSKAVTTLIKAESKVTLKIKDNFYSVTVAEERAIPDIEGVDVAKERAILFDDLNATIDAQAEDIMQTFKR